MLIYFVQHEYLYFQNSDPYCIPLGFFFLVEPHHFYTVGLLRISASKQKMRARVMAGA